MKHLLTGSNFFAGNRYVLEGDTAVMLLFDHMGKIAGIQNGVSFHILSTFSHSFRKRLMITLAMTMII